MRKTESATRRDLPLPITILNWQIFGFYASEYRGRQAAESCFRVIASVLGV